MKRLIMRKNCLPERRGIMTDQEVKAAVQTAIECVKRESPPLVFQAVHERSTAHRLAVHMEPNFPGWNVDCEYDRDDQARKELGGIAHCDEQKKTDAILPDIIVHHRECKGPTHNLIVIELKKNFAEDPCDKEKLKLLTCLNGKYQYQLGLYINVAGGKFECMWYKNGNVSLGR